MTSFTSSRQNKRQKTDIIRRTRFFHVIDNRASNVIIKDVFEEENVSEFWWGAAILIKYWFLVLTWCLCYFYLVVVVFQ